VLFRKKIAKFWHNEDGPTAVEYAIMLAGIVGVCIATVFILANATEETFERSSNAITNAIGGGN